jgi:hypothetical protein
MQLLATQRAFTAQIRAGDAAFLADIASDPDFDAAARAAVYREGYAIRLTEALDANYPMLHRLLGDEQFSLLARKFIAANPSTHRSIRWYGSELGEFLRATSPYAQQPVFAELASWEWAMTEAFDSADAGVVERAEVTRVAAQDFADLRFSLHPSLRRLDLEWNTPAIWQALSKDEVPPQAEKQAAPIPWVIWRQELTTYFRSIDTTEAAAIKLANSGRSFGEICETLATLIGADNAASVAAGYLDGWLGSGQIASLRTGL